MLLSIVHFLREVVSFSQSVGGKTPCIALADSIRVIGNKDYALNIQRQGVVLMISRSINVPNRETM